MKKIIQEMRFEKVLYCTVKKKGKLGVALKQYNRCFTYKFASKQSNVKYAIKKGKKIFIK